METLTRRFYAARALHVDGIDIEPSAINYAQKYNSAPNIRFQQLDAVVEPFPDFCYDVIVFDGAIAHFSREGAIAVLKKISGTLSPNGIFCGSESLGHEGDDHLQHFETLDDLRSLLRSVFPYVRVKSQKYRITGGYQRHEAYWRAANADVLRQWEWQ